jgi:single-strand DNA-binding protein
MNKVIICGNLGQAPDLKNTNSGIPVCTLSVATNKSYKDKNGQQVDKTEWHRVQVWQKQAENCAKFLSKGSKVLVEGELQTREWEDKDKIKRYTTEIVASHVQFLDNKSGGARPPHPADTAAPNTGVPPADAGGGDFTQDTIPF